MSTALSRRQTAQSLHVLRLDPIFSQWNWVEDDGCIDEKRGSIFRRKSYPNFCRRVYVLTTGRHCRWAQQRSRRPSTRTTSPSVSQKGRPLCENQGGPIPHQGSLRVLQHQSSQLNICSTAPYEKRIMELLRNNKDKRARKLAKKRVCRGHCLLLITVGDTSQGEEKG
jgi:Ribosomal protein L36e